MQKKGRLAAWSLLLLCILVSGLCFSAKAEDTCQTASLKWMIYGEKTQEWDRVFQEFNEELHQFYPNMNVEFEVISKDSYARQWEMKMAAGESIDIVWIGSEVLSFSEEVKKGNFMAMDYLLNICGKDLTEQIPQELWEKQKRDSNTYGIPVLGPLYRENRTLIVNKNLMDRYGDFEEILTVNREYPYTGKECFTVMEPFLEKVKENHALGKGVDYQSVCKLADKGYEGLYGVDSPFVIRIFDEKPVVYNKYELDSYRDCFEVMSDWYQKGYIREDVAYLINPGEENGKISGNILFVEETGEKKSVFDQIDTEYESLQGDLEGYRYISGDTGRNCLVIPKTSKYPKEAMELLNLLHSEEGKELYRLLANGVEKTDYIRVRQDTDIIARMTDNNHHYKYSVSPVNFGNLFHGFELCEGQFDKIQENNQQAMISRLEGFELDVRMIAVEMKKIDLIVQRYKEPLIEGITQDWETEYQEFCAEMKAAGSQKVVEEIQRQIDRFLVQKNS